MQLWEEMQVIVGCEYKKLELNLVFSFFYSRERSSTKKYFTHIVSSRRKQYLYSCREESLCIVVIVAIVVHDLVVITVRYRQSSSYTGRTFEVFSLLKYKEATFRIVVLNLWKIGEISYTVDRYIEK